MTDPTAGASTAAILVLGTETAYLDVYEDAAVARSYADGAPDRRCFDARGWPLEPDEGDGLTVAREAPADEEIRAGVARALAEVNASLAPLEKLLADGASGQELIAEIDREDTSTVAAIPDGPGADEGVGRRIRRIFKGLFG